MLTRFVSRSTHGRTPLVFILSFSLIAGFAVSLAQAQNNLFPGPRNYGIGASPNAVVIGDFNGDGLPDIATANGWAYASPYSNNVSVLMQNSDGTFQTAVNYPVGLNAFSMQAGDFNGDGKLDLAVLNLADLTLSVLMNNGDGTFQAQKITTIPTGNLIDGTFTVGDFDHDGKLDIALQIETAQVNNYAVLILRGNGDGTFQTGASLSISGRGPIQAADVNNDGKLDLVVLSGQTEIVVFLGKGDGTFQSAVVTQANQVYGVGFVIADFNRDGKPDVVVGPSTDFPSAYIFLGNGDGSFQAGSALPQSPDASATPVSTADLNGDGNPDLVLSGQSLLTVYFGKGDGTFTVGPILPVNSNDVHIAQADLNGDGKIDLVSAYNNTDASAGLPEIATVWFGNGDGTFAQTPSYPALGGAVVTADFNNDGRPDLGTIFYFVVAGRGSASQLSLLLNQGASFGAANITKNTGGPYGVAADLRGNGIPDVVIGTAGDGIYNGIGVLLGNGDGTVQPEVFYGENMAGPLATGDFNNDGKLDIVGVNALSQIGTLLGNGDGTFGFPVLTNLGGNQGISNLVVGDFNGDGNLDVVAILNYYDLIVVLLGNGDGTFTQAATTYPLLTTSAGAMAPGDVNGDGKLDLLVGYPPTLNSSGVWNPATVAVYLGNGDGTFQSPISTMEGSGASSFALADFNLDGKLDLAVSNPGWYETAVLLGKGDGTFEPPVEYATGGSSLTVADFAGKGSADIATTNGSGAAVLYNQLSGPAAVLSKSSVNFGNQGIAYTSSPAGITLTNSGAEVLAIHDIGISGAQASDYSISSNTCSGSVSPGATCQIAITFTPPVTGSRTARLQITDNAFNSPQVVVLTGAGATPAPGASLALTSVSFGNELLGSTSAAQTVTLTNSGTIPLQISGIAVGGVQASDFSIVSNDCGSTLVNATSCTVGIQFAPEAAGSRSANLTITDNAATSPQSMSLSGTGVQPSIGLGVPSSESSSATVTAGEAATYKLAIGGAGVSGAVSLTCSGAPAQSTCTVPSSQTISGTTVSQFTVSVTTTPRTTGALTRPNGTNMWLWATALMAGVLMIKKRPEQHGRRRRFVLMIAALAFLLSLMVACGGSSGSSSSSSGTPPGTYTLTVTATMGSTTQSLPLTLRVN